MEIFKRKRSTRCKTDFAQCFWQVGSRRKARSSSQKRCYCFFTVAKRW